MVYGSLIPLRRVLELAAWLPPARCVVCDAAATVGGLCPACIEDLPWLQVACPCCAQPLPSPATTGPCARCQAQPGPLDIVQAAFLYAPPVDRLERRFKFHRDLAAGHALATALAARAAGWPRPQALVPLPLQRARLRRRGYDQAWEIGRVLARQLALPCLPGLHRVRATEPQTRLDAAQRRRNLYGAFMACGTLPSHVALVDDVMTTGATLTAAAEALRAAGVARVDAWVCARVPAPDGKPTSMHGPFTL